MLDILVNVGSDTGATNLPTMGAQHYPPTSPSLASIPTEVLSLPSSTQNLTLYEAEVGGGGGVGVGDGNQGANQSWAVLLLVPIILCSVVGNLLVCLAISKDQKLQSLTNLFIFSMAIADLMVALLVMPFGLAKDLLGYWPMDHIACNIWTTLDVFCCTSSILHMCTVSIDRYVAICDPLRHKRQPRTRCGIILKICVVWLAAAALSSPLCIIGFLQPGTVINDRSCAVNNVPFMIYGSVVAFFIPLCIVVVTYSLTTYALYKKSKLYDNGNNDDVKSDLQKTDMQRTYPRFVIHMVKRNDFEQVSIKEAQSDSSSNESLAIKKELPGHFSRLSLSSDCGDDSLKRNAQHIQLRRMTSHSGHCGMKRFNSEQRASKVLGLVFTAFVVGWTPFFVANMTDALCSDCKITGTVFTTCTWIGWASSMVNPFIYTAFNIRFRRAFLKYLTCKLYYVPLVRVPTNPTGQVGPTTRDVDRGGSLRQKMLSFDADTINRNHGKALWTLTEVSK